MHVFITQLRPPLHQAFECTVPPIVPQSLEPENLTHSYLRTFGLLTKLDAGRTAVISFDGTTSPVEVTVEGWSHLEVWGTVKMVSGQRGL